MTPLEDRTTPTTVNATAMADAYESGTEGIIRISRDGSTANSLDVEWSIGGTAVADTDYVDFNTFDVIPAGESYIDVPIVPIWNRVADTGSRTVSITIEYSTGGDYDPGTAATVSIYDDVDTEDVLIHHQEFQLTGSGDSVNVILDVTYTAPVYSSDPGTYKWVYQVENPSSMSKTWTEFKVPFSDGGADVDNLQDPAYWTGTINADNVQWTSLAGLAPGNFATFSFTTDPRWVDSGDIAVRDANNNAADLPTAPAPRVVDQFPLVKVKFNTSNLYGLTLRATLPGDNAVYSTGEIIFDYLQDPTGARNHLFQFLMTNGWDVVKVDNADDLYIRGKKVNGEVKGIKTLSYEFTDPQGQGQQAGFPTFVKSGQVTVGPYSP